MMEEDELFSELQFRVDVGGQTKMLKFSESV